MTQFYHNSGSGKIRALSTLSRAKFVASAPYICLRCALRIAFVRPSSRRFALRVSISRWRCHLSVLRDLIILSTTATNRSNSSVLSVSDRPNHNFIEKTKAFCIAISRKVVSLHRVSSEARHFICSNSVPN